MVHMDARPSPLLVKVASISRETDEILKFVLVDPAGGELPSFAAGAHVDVHLADGLTRQYSLLSSPRDRRRYVIAVKREPNSRGGSAMMHGRLAAGDQLRISAPRNNFNLDPGAAHHLLVAGGIGITPLLSMADHLAATAGSYTLAYFVRARDLAGFADELAGTARAGRLQVHPGLDAGATTAAVASLLTRQADGTHVYVCGPRPLMDAVGELARASGHALPVHREDFSAAPLASEPGVAAFEVRLAQSGETVLIPPDRTIADVLIEQGVALDTSCEMGMCGTCLTRVLGGVPDHRDTFLSEAERAAGLHILPCVSRSKTPLLVLDL